jgi:hypothetical protein
MNLAIAADNLDLALGKLWDLRATRDINWRTILNHVQGMIRQLFAARRIEQLSPAECEVFVELVNRYLGPATRTLDDLNDALRLVEDAGFDPYAAVSGDPGADEPEVPFKE